MPSDAVHHQYVVAIVIIVGEKARWYSFGENRPPFLHTQLVVGVADACHVEDGHIDIYGNRLDPLEGNDMHKPFPIRNNLERLVIQPVFVEQFLLDICRRVGEACIVKTEITISPSALFARK